MMGSNHVTGTVSAQATLNVAINGVTVNGTNYIENTNITLTASTSDASVPTSQVNFYNGATTIATITAVGNTATFIWTIPNGTLTIDIHASANHA